jgi:hypothetical protein
MPSPPMATYTGCRRSCPPTSTCRRRYKGGTAILARHRPPLIGIPYVHQRRARCNARATFVSPPVPRWQPEPDGHQQPAERAPRALRGPAVRSFPPHWIPPAHCARDFVSALCTQPPRDSNIRVHSAAEGRTARSTQSTLSSFGTPRASEVVDLSPRIFHTPPSTPALRCDHPPP